MKRHRLSRTLLPDTPTRFPIFQFQSHLMYTYTDRLPSPAAVIASFSLVSLVSLVNGPEPLFADQSNDEPAPLVWVGHGADEMWSNAWNWREAQTPGATESRHVFFPGEPGGWVPVMLDRDQTLHGGLRMSGHRGTVRLVLQDHTLTLAGEAFYLGGTRNSPVVTEGVVQLGTEDGAVEWRVFDDGGNEEHATFTDSATVRFVNCARLLVGHATGNRNAHGTLDLSDATIDEGRLHVVDDLRVGYYRGSIAGRGGEGVLLLPTSVSRMRVGTLAIGENRVAARRIGRSPTYARGVVDFGGGDVLTLVVDEALILGRGDNVSADLEDLPARVDLTLGEADRPAVAWLGYNDRSQAESEPEDNAAVGRFVSPGGVVDAHVSELRVGHNAQAAGSASGVLDLTAASLERFEVAGEAVIGKGVAAEGVVCLPAGDATIGRLVLGSDDDGASGTLELTDTRLSIEEELVIGEGGRLRIVLERSAGDAVERRWALRVAGDVVEMLETAIEEGRIDVAATGVDEDRIVVFVHEGDTYIGMAFESK